jgi:hypothetical protein
MTTEPAKLPAAATPRRMEGRPLPSGPEGETCPVLTGAAHRAADLIETRACGTTGVLAFERGLPESLPACGERLGGRRCGGVLGLG